jgi:hypothetical protein
MSKRIEMNEAFPAVETNALDTIDTNSLFQISGGVVNLADESTKQLEADLLASGDSKEDLNQIEAPWPRYIYDTGLRGRLEMAVAAKQDPNVAR